MRDRVKHYADGLAQIDAGEGPPWAPELAAAIRDGESPLDFAERTGHSRSRCYEILNDPFKAKVRERKGTYICEHCEAEKPHDGSREKPRLCATCLNAERTEEARENVLLAIQEWVELYGRPPTACDWSPASWPRMSADYRRVAEERYAVRKWPHPTGVQGVFGSWNEAIEAAGFEPVGTGERRNPELWRSRIRKRYATAA